MAGVICDRKIVARVEKKVYRVVVGKKLELAKLKMLRLSLVDRLSILETS